MSAHLWMSLLQQASLIQAYRRSDFHSTMMPCLRQCTGQSCSRLNSHGYHIQLESGGRVGSCNGRFALAEVCILPFALHLTRMPLSPLCWVNHSTCHI
ncbi:TPA: hypothetical protein ACH3X2_012137 [Trebouxia sp. C0005]